MRLSASIRRYLDQIDTLKKPNTYRKYNAVLTRFDQTVPGPGAATNLNRGVERASSSSSGRERPLGPNTVLHNVIIIAQFCLGVTAA